VHYVHTRDPERLERVVSRHQASGSDRPVPDCREWLLWGRALGKRASALRAFADVLVRGSYLELCLAQWLAAGEAAEAAGSKAGEDADAAGLAGASALEAAACGALAACAAALAATWAAFAAFAAAINSRCRALTHSSTMRRAVLTLSSIDLVAICTISVSPLPSSSRTGPVVDSTGLIRRSRTQPLAVLWRRRREVTLRSVPGALFESRAP